MENAQHPAAAAQQSADAAFSAAWKAARKNGGSFTHATDDAGVHGVIERHAPEKEMTKTFAVIDANSAYWTPEGETEYERATFVQAGSPAEACAKAREEGFDGLLIASQQDA